MIESRADLFRAIKSAADGDVLSVGDVDFRTEGGGAKHEAERITLDKSLTIKSGKHGNAVFTGGSFLVNGSKVAGEKTVLHFENVTFDGAEEVAALTGADWDLSYDEGTGDPVSNYTLKAQYAVSCKGNVRATFSGCDFTGYMHEQGPAVRLFYGDYSADPYAATLYGDNAECRADLSFKDCSFARNAAFYGGGAVYAEGCRQNLSLRFDACTFERNHSGVSDYSAGAGAVYLSDAIATFDGCRFDANVGNRFYDGAEEPYDPDQTLGGAILCNMNCRLTATDCVFTANRASQGGAIALRASTGAIRGCAFDGNVAAPYSAPAIKSLTSCGGLGGALYFNNPENFSIVNTTIVRNVAENAYGAVYTDYSANLEAMGLGARKVDFLFCTIADNTANASESEFYKYGEESCKWRTYPSDFWSIPYVNAKASVVVDALAAKHEAATADNDYCYFATPDEADAEGYLRDYQGTGNRLSFPAAAVVPKEYAASLFPDQADFLTSDLSLGASESAVILYTDPYTESGTEPAPSDPIIEKPASLPPYAVALICLGAVLLAAGAIAIAALAYNKKRKTAKNAELSDETVNAEPIAESDVERVMRTHPDVQPLSEREKEVLTAVLMGKTRKQIGEMLFISESTVKKHLASIYMKMGVASRSELLANLYNPKS